MLLLAPPSLSRVVVEGRCCTAGETTATQTVGCLDVDVHGRCSMPLQLVQSRHALLKPCEAEKVENPVAKAQAG